MDTYCEFWSHTSTILSPVRSPLDDGLSASGYARSLEERICNSKVRKDPTLYKRGSRTRKIVLRVFLTAQVLTHSGKLWHKIVNHVPCVETGEYWIDTKNC